MLQDDGQDIRVLTTATAPAGGPEPELPARQTIEALGEARGYSLCDLAARAGMMPDHLRAIEAGLEPTIPERQAIAAALGVDVEMIR